MALVGVGASDDGRLTSGSCYHYNDYDAHVAQNGHSMIRLSRLGHVELAVRDLDAAVGHHRDLLGLVEVARDANAVHLSTGADHHAVVLRRADEDAILHLGYQLDPDLSLQDARRELADHGVDAQLETDAEPGIAELLELSDPEGNRLQLYRDSDATGHGPGTGPIRPQKLGHVCLRARDVPALVRWYEDVLRFRWSDWLGDFFVFLRCAADHHVLNLVEAQRPGTMHHVAYELRDWNEIQPALDALAARGVGLVWGPGRHGPGHNIFTYHHDPAGNLVELFTQLDVMDDALGCFEARPWHQDRPQRPKRWSTEDLTGPNQWGPLPPDQFLT